MLHNEDVSAVIVTRGDVDIQPIVDSLPFEDIIVWDNSTRPEDLSVFGRYQAAAEAKNDLIYVQDDDCIVPVDQLLASWEEDDTLLCNMPVNHGSYTDSALVGWGAVFKKMLPYKAFFRYVEFNPIDDSFFRACDVVFTTLTPFRRVDIGHDNMDYAYGDNRMYNQFYHNTERSEVLRRARYVRDFPHPYWTD